MNPTTLFDIAAGILDATGEAIEDAGLVVPERTAVVGGAIATWEDCCPGQLTVRLQRLFRARIFPAEEADVRAVSGCDDSTLAVTYTVEMTHCNPTGDKSSPSAEVVTDHASLVLQYALAMFLGVQCWAHRFEETAMIGALDPLGPEADCIGYQVPVTVDLGPVCPCGALDG